MCLPDLLVASLLLMLLILIMFALEILGLEHFPCKHSGKSHLTYRFWLVFLLRKNSVCSHDSSEWLVDSCFLLYEMSECLSATVDVETCWLLAMMIGMHKTCLKLVYSFLVLLLLDGEVVVVL